MAFFAGDGGNRFVSTRDRAVMRQRGEEARVQELKKFASDITAMGTIHGRDEAVEYRRRRAEVDTLEFEEMMEARTRTAMIEARRKALQADQEAALMVEMERRKREEESKRLEIQRICEADPSLRDLQNKLKMAYVSRERFGQIKEKEVIIDSEKAAARAAAEDFEARRLAALEAEKHAQIERREREMASKGELQKQLIEKEMRDFLQAEEEAKRERAMVADILSKIHAEDEAEAATRAKARDETIRVIEQFKRQREAALVEQRAREREEEHKIAQYAVAQASRDEHIKRARAEDLAVREAKYRAIVEEQEALRAKQEEEDALRWLLVEEEAEQRRVAAEMKRKEDSEKSRREMMVANEEQKRIRERVAIEEAGKEAALIKQFLDKCKEDEKRVAMARKAREEARLLYMAEIQSQRDERLALFQAQKMDELKALEEEKRKEEFKKQVIAEARQRMLEEHAAALRGFLPRGVILSNADLDILKAFDRNSDGKLEPEEMELAQAAFMAFDPNKRAAAATSAPPASAPLGRPSSVDAGVSRATTRGGSGVTGRR